MTPNTKAIKAKQPTEATANQKATVQQKTPSTEWKGNCRMGDNVCKPYI